MLANFALFAAAADRARLGVQSNIESTLADRAELLAGTEALSLLDRVQGLLTSRTFDCSTADRSIQSGIGTLSISQQYGEVTVSEEISVGPSTVANDNMSMLKPFIGSGPSELPLNLQVKQLGSDYLAGVYYSKVENHTLSLPVAFSSMTKMCIDSVGFVRESLEALTLNNCTTGALEPLIPKVEGAFPQMEDSAGIVFSLDIWADNSDGCSAHYISLFTQAGVAGPEGPFSVLMEEAGSVPVQISNSTVRA
jgi:hypothetical protein